MAFKVQVGPAQIAIDQGKTRSCWVFSIARAPKEKTGFPFERERVCVCVAVRESCGVACERHVRFEFGRQVKRQLAALSREAELVAQGPRVVERNFSR